MKKAKREDGSNSNDRLSDLPKDILHRILYFLSQEDVVRTSVLSKSWRNIWCTRSNLDLSDINFKGNKQNFLLTVDNTLQRYGDQNLCLEEFDLYISLLGKYYSDHELVSLLEKWVPLLTSMGVKEFHLAIIPKHSVGVIIDMPVVLKAEPLKILCLYDCNLGQCTLENIPFVRPQELELINVLIEKETLHKIITSCPLLTRLSKLLQALRHSEISMNILHRYLEDVHIEEDDLVRDIIINGGNKPVAVENLEFNITHLSLFPYVLNGFLGICRPRNITPLWFWQRDWKREKLLKQLDDFLCNIENMKESGNREIWQDLEDLTLQGFDESRKEWQPLHVARFSESALLSGFDRFRVQLKWRYQNCESSSKLIES